MNFSEMEMHKKAGNHSPLFFNQQMKKSYALIGLAMLLFFFILPILKLFLLSVQHEGVFTSSYYQEVLHEKATWTSVKNTLIITGGSTALSVLIGVSMAWIMAYCNVRGKKWMALFVFFPFIIPSYITALAWVQFFSLSGPAAAFLNLLSLPLPLPNLYSIGGIIFILGISHYPLVFLLTVDVFRKIPSELEEAARTSGAAKKTVFWKMLLPIALPGIGSGGLLALLSNLDNFGIPAFLGIPANIRVLSTYIYEQVVGLGPEAFSKAAVLSVLLGFFALIATVIQWLLLKKSRVLETAKPSMEPRVYLGTKARLVLEGGIWLFLLGTGLVPFITMAAISLIKAYGLPFALENLSFKHYEYLLFHDPKTIPAAVTSLKLAFITMTTGLLVGTGFAYARFKNENVLMKGAEIIVTVPYALPGTVFGLSMILTWMQPVPGWNPGIYGSIWILLIAYTTRFIILQVRSSLSALSQLDPSIEEAARVSGAKVFSRWRHILGPLMLPGLLGGALLVFLTALTELTVSSLLWSAGTETIGVVIFNFEQAGYSAYSTAFSSIIVLGILTGAVLFIMLSNVWNRKVLKKR